MPVQINELVIRANIKEQDGSAKDAKAVATDKPDKEEIIKECIERVLEILNQQNER
jgi:hypothetical protein